MNVTSLVFLGSLLFTTEAYAALSVDQYILQIQNKGAQGRALVENVRAMELKLDEADAITTTELYGQAGLSDDQSEKLIPYMGSRTEGLGWTLGLKKQFLTGTSANLYYDSHWANLTNAAGISQPNYWENKATLELVQPLWRNGFGSEVRANYDLKESQAKANLLQAQFDLKTFLLDSQNIYWSLVTYDQVIKLQEENVDRSRRLRDLMAKKAKLRLIDDVDYLQVQASLESRELELQTSRDERANLARQFNIRRGEDLDSVEILDPLPAELTTQVKADLKKATREDFENLKAIAEVSKSAARAGRSRLRPQLDIVGTVSANGMDAASSRARTEVTDIDHGSWSIGVRFSTSIDVGLTRDIYHSYVAQQRAANDLSESAEFQLRRQFKALVEQLGEAQKRYERAINLEKLQTELVKRERQRLNNGRTTTFQLISLEQNLAAVQIQAVQARLGLVKVHNTLKTFKESP